ncbi:MAG: hypothetical protein ACYCS2_09920, partial [Acidimicrobiales bacterium]
MIEQPSWTGEEPLLFELAQDPDRAPRLPSAGVSAPGIDSDLPVALRRRRRAHIPALNEPELARHFGRLARRNHNLQQGPYPLG